MLKSLGKDNAKIAKNFLFPLGDSRTFKKAFQ